MGVLRGRGTHGADLLSSRLLYETCADESAVSMQPRPHEIPHKNKQTVFEGPLLGILVHHTQTRLRDVEFGQNIFAMLKENKHTLYLIFPFR